uniref:Apolipoprotein A-II n=1 Tax=Neogobius melanostomus TaxID=47308 RepID=A0A8C6TF16_9GOBI
MDKKGLLLGLILLIQVPPYIIQSRCEHRVTDNSLSERTVTRAAADMNAKFVFVVLLALQVSVALCDLPAPDEDLVVKYDEMKATFKRRLENLWGKMQAAAADNPNAQAAKDAIANNEKVGTAREVFSAIGDEVAPVVDKARTGLLSVYSYYLRPHVGETLQQSIDKIKSVLDQVMPADN